MENVSHIQGVYETKSSRRLQNQFSIVKAMDSADTPSTLKCRVNDTNTLSEPEGDVQPSTRNSGVLQKSGKQYFVYRMLIYCDDLTPQLGKPSSMGGCYLLPVVLPIEWRSGSGATRPISLTPRRVSTSFVLSEIADDLLRGTQNGSNCKYFKGDDIVVFLDVGGIIGDYPAVSHMTSVLGNNANVPFPLCVFPRKDRSGQGGSRHGYSTQAHGLHPSFARSEGRATAIYESNPPKEVLYRMGMRMITSKQYMDMGLNALSQGQRELRLQGRAP